MRASTLAGLRTPLPVTVTMRLTSGRPSRTHVAPRRRRCRRSGRRRRRAGGQPSCGHLAAGDRGDQQCPRRRAGYTVGSTDELEAASSARPASAAAGGDRLGLVVLDRDRAARGAAGRQHDLCAEHHVGRAFAHQRVVAADPRLALGAVQQQRSAPAARASSSFSAVGNAAPPRPAMPAAAMRASSVRASQRVASRAARARGSRSSRPSLSMTMQRRAAAQRGSTRRSRGPCPTRRRAGRSRHRRPRATTRPDPHASPTSHHGRGFVADALVERQQRRWPAAAATRIGCSAAASCGRRCRSPPRMMVRALMRPPSAHPHGRRPRRCGSIAMQSTGQGGRHSSQPVHCASITVCISAARRRWRPPGRPGRHRRSRCSDPRR